MTGTLIFRRICKFTGQDRHLQVTGFVHLKQINFGLMYEFSINLQISLHRTRVVSHLIENADKSV